MNPDDPSDAQRVVAEYAAVLERHTVEERYPASVSTLPFSKETIKASIRTAAVALTTTGQMTDDIREFLEVAYTSLADYVDDEVARIMAEYREASAALAADSRLGREKVDTPAWQVLRDTSGLVAQIARTIAEESETLRAEFRALA